MTEIALPFPLVRVVVLITTLTISATSCGDSGPDADAVDMRVDDRAVMDTTPAGTPAPPTLPSLADDAERQARVTLSEWAVATDRQQLPAGEITLQVANTGIEPHSLAIEGDQGVTARTASILPGEVQSLSVDFAAGTYRLFCADTVAGDAHADRGMTTPLVVR